MEVLALILAGGRGSRLDILSEHRVKPAVPFAGKFRIIDFALSNCSNSGIFNIGILTQYLPLSLNEHIRQGEPWDFSRRDGGVTLLQPTSEWYKGTADAVLQNIEYLKRQKSKYTLILSGDHIYKMDYSKVLEEHKKNNADLSITVQPVPWDEASRFGILETDESLKITKFVEKPAEPKSNLASMGIYIFNTDVLIEALETIKAEDLDFGHHVIPEMINTKNVYAYKFEDYWKDVGTLDSYLEANLDLISTVDKMQLDMYDPEWAIHTRSEEKPSVKFGTKARCVSSLVSNGCIVAGDIEKCVLGPGVIIHPGATIRNAVIFNDTEIKAGAVIDGAIIDKECVIGENVVIGSGEDYTINQDNPKVLQSGLNVIGKGATVADNTVITRNVRIFPETTSASGTIKAGDTIKE